MSRYMRVAAMTATTALLTMGGIATANASTVVPGTNAANPIIVKSLTEVPQGAVQDKVSTYQTDAPCDTTRSWVLLGTDAVTHPEGQYLRVVPEQDAVTHDAWNMEGRFRTYTPAVEEVSHQEFKYERTVEVSTTETRSAVNEYTPGTDKVCPDYEYQYKQPVTECTDAIWQNFSPNKDQKTFEGPPSWPTDSRGTWQHDDKAIPAGHEGPDGVYQQGEGNASWFYRQAAACHETGDYTYKWFVTDPGSPWVATEKKRPVEGTGSPATAGSWSGWLPEPLDTENGWTGEEPTIPGVIKGSADQPDLTWTQTRQVLGTETQTTDWLLAPPEGDGWMQVDERKVVTTEASDAVYGDWSDWTPINKAPIAPKPTPPANTDTHQYRVVGPITVTDEEAVPGYTEYFVLGAAPSRNIDDASWVMQSPGESWTLFTERIVTDTAAVAPVFYAWSDNATCTVVDDATNPTTPTAVAAAEAPAALAQTGGNAWLPVGIGMALLLAGTALVMAGRTKRVTTA